MSYYITKSLLQHRPSAELLDTIDDTVVHHIVTQERREKVLEALGYFEKVLPESLTSDMRPEARISILIGAAEHANEQTEENTLNQRNELILQARQIFLENSSNNRTIKALVQGFVGSTNYETGSNDLLGLFDFLKTRTGKEGIDNKIAIRILKGLTELDNPRGNDFATALFASGTLPAHYQEFLLKKLFINNYWDIKLQNTLIAERKLLTNEEQKAIAQVDGNERKALLREYSQKLVTLEARQREICRTLFTEFNLTPDVAAYQMLEKPGDLVADTLEGRIGELKAHQEQFAGKSNHELIKLLIEDERLMRIYYVSKAGENRYRVVNNYTFAKFKKTLETIYKLPIHQPTLEKYKQILQTSGLPENEAQQVIDDMTNGKPLVQGKQRSFRFYANIEFGSNYEIAFNRMQDVWKKELASLILAKRLNVEPENIQASLALLTTQNIEDFLQHDKLAIQLRLLQDKITTRDIADIAKDIRNKLRTKQKGNKPELERIDGLADQSIITEYLLNQLPSSDATTEWMNHLAEVLASVQESEAELGSKKQPKPTEIEMTFLDKNEDFMQAIRFADAAQCCFNSSDENFQARTLEYTTRLNKDPLSFSIALRQPGSREYIGFVFGRTVLDPETMKPVIALNGIYSQLKGQTINDNILRLIEQEMGTRLHTNDIIIASKFGGTIKTPTQYEPVENIEFQALRALADHNDEPEEKTYDDIGEVANGTFLFSGYRKIRTP